MGKSRAAGRRRRGGRFGEREILSGCAIAFYVQIKYEVRSSSRVNRAGFFLTIYAA